MDQHPSSSRSGSRGPQPGTEAARRGGRVVRERYGREFYQQMGRRGGERVRERYGPDFYRRIGRLGGEATQARYGNDYYARIHRKRFHEEESAP